MSHPQALMPVADRIVVLLVLGSTIGVGGYLLWQAALTPGGVRPGTPLGQSLGIAAGILTLLSVGHVGLKRTDTLEVSKRRLQVLHMAVGTLAVALAVAHSGLRFVRPPGLIGLVAVGLLLSGLYGRLLAPARAARAFGHGATAFTPAARRDPGLAERVRETRAVLRAFGASAAGSAPTLYRLADFGRHPLLTARFFVLRARERRLQRAHPAAWDALGVAERVWRLLHLGLAALVILGLAAHVITTTLFAGYVAGDREVYWWHWRR